jgi:hypothetical protein
MNKFAQTGYTLLEMLLVIGILSMTAFGMATITEGVQDGSGIDQLRFEETKRRLDVIRKAVAGDPQVTVNGEPLVSGFVADMGRLPINLRELVQHPEDCDGDGTDDELDADGNGKPDACQRQHDPVSTLDSGWNGPYLQAPAEIGGGRAFRDGWGNKGDDSDDDYGWLVAVTDIDGEEPPNDWDDTLSVQSLGADLKEDPDATYPYAKEYPADGDAVLLAHNDHRIDLTDGGPDGIGRLTIKFVNPGDGSGDPSEGGTEAYVCLYFPRNGKIDWIASDKKELSSVPDGETVEVEFTFSGQPKDLWIPWGRRAVKVFKFEDSKCPNDESKLYPSGEANSVKVRTVTFVPHADKPTVDWPLE